MVEIIVELEPRRIIIRIAWDDEFFNTPRLLVMAPPDHLALEAVILDVNAASQDQHALRQFYWRAIVSGAVVFTARQHGILVSEIAAILPQLAEHGVVYNL